MVRVIDRVLLAEADALTGALARLSPPQWEQPTRCEPWRVRDVVGHLVTVLSRVPEMLAAPAPPGPDTTAAGYYRADHRFGDVANAGRVQAAHDRAATLDGAGDLAAMVQTVVGVSRREPAGRVVRTRHGDAMLLTDFLTTRVVELAVHGLDIADALGHRPWLTTPAAEHLQQLLFGPQWRAAVTAFGGDCVMLLRKSTGRAPVTADESAELVRLGLRPLTLS